MPLKPLGKSFLFDSIIATGGIGTGLFFSLEGDHTLGREESRLGKLESYKDYCKQHIILHYLAVLLIEDHKGPAIYPIGKVGDDAAGKDLIAMMQQVGMNTNTIDISRKSSTSFSVCFQYPKGEGGNLTSSNGASGDLNINDIRVFFEKTGLTNLGKSLVIAAPEVPLEVRIDLLKSGAAYGFTNVASVLSSEWKEFKDKGGVKVTTILSINIDEAKSISKLNDTSPVEDIVEATIAIIIKENKDITILITNGSKGSYCYDRKVLRYTPVVLVKQVKSTAGAGDAFLSGFLVGMCCGLPIHKLKNDTFFAEFPLETAVELGTLIAGLKVTCSDTIDLTINADRLRKFCSSEGYELSSKFKHILNK